VFDILQLNFGFSGSKTGPEMDKKKTRVEDSEVSAQSIPTQRKPMFSRPALVAYVINSIANKQ
jgi:hypothetical protein